MIEEAIITQFQVFLLDWYTTNKREFPWRYTFDPYLVLVSEILLQQTNAHKAIDPYKKIISRCKDISALAEVDIEFLKDIFKKIGLFYRADRLISISNEIISKYESSIPRNWNELISIKGIGYYTCSAVLCFGYNKPYAVLDTNVIRILKRVFNEVSYTKRSHTDKRLWDFAQYILPESNYVDYNYALLDFAATVCSNKNPKCTVCPLKRSCLNSITLE
jgi:A/G-specific adenine glycosylase